ncbi:MAG: LptA/(LptD N-terminal domain) transport protein [Candidatus Eremiobacteraeota bacterium]|nr:LptA/(LptD N-terminal domain) transport protein [Candidatus Eremiobacteraeota bacterium]
MTTHRFLNLLLPLGLVLTCGTTALAAPTPSPSAPGLQTAAYRIETDETKANFNTGDFTMPHRVRFFRPGTDAIGDRAQGNSKRGTVSLFGNVVVHDSGNASEASDAAYKGSGPATLTCDQLDVDSKARVYTATGNFHFTQGTRTGSANRAMLDRTAGTLHLEGNVHLSDNGSTISANVVDYNLNTKDVQTHGSPTIMTQPATQQPAPAPRATPAAARHTPAPRRTPTRAPSPKPSGTP